MEEKKHYHHGKDTSSIVYGLGFVGAVVYYLQTATSLGAGVVWAF